MWYEGKAWNQQRETGYIGGMFDVGGDVQRGQWTDIPCFQTVF